MRSSERDGIWIVFLGLLMFTLLVSLLPRPPEGRVVARAPVHATVHQAPRASPLRVLLRG